MKPTIKRTEMAEVPPKCRTIKKRPQTKASHSKNSRQEKSEITKPSCSRQNKLPNQVKTNLNHSTIPAEAASQDEQLSTDMSPTAAKKVKSSPKYLSTVLYSPSENVSNMDQPIKISVREIAKITGLDVSRCKRLLGKNVTLEDTINMDPKCRYTLQYPEYDYVPEIDDDILDYIGCNRAVLTKHIL